MSPRRPARLALAVLTATLVSTGTVSAPADARGDGQGDAGRAPSTYRLPDGFQPEGVAVGPGRVAYLGSRVDGRIRAVDLRTGRSRLLARGPGTPSLGMKVDGRRLFVAGGTGGDARVISTRTGRTLRSYPLASGDAFVNDVVLTGRSAWFTDSTNPVLYRLPLGRDGRLPTRSQVRRIPLRGEIVYGPDVNANGITTTPDRRALLVVQSSTGQLFRVNKRTGVARTVDLRGTSLANGDGMLREGRRLYVVQNRLDRIAVLRLSKDGRRARLVRTVTSRRFDVPTTVARDRGRLVLPNARFTTPATPDTRYDLVTVKDPRRR